jgi:hypothetical protein
MDVKKRYLMLEPGNFCLSPPETRKSQLTTNGSSVTTIDKLEKGGSSGTVIFNEPYRNILEINCIDADFPPVSMCICLPEIAPYGVWEHCPFEKSLQRVTASSTSLSTYDVKPEKLPELFNKNWFPVSNRYSSLNTQGVSPFNPIPVAKREKNQPPFNLSQLTMFAFVTQNNINPQWTGGSGFTGAGTEDDASRPLARYTWFDVSNFNSTWNSTSSSTDTAYTEQQQQQQYFFEIVMLDETPHIARMPNADGYFEEYEDEFEVTGRQRRLAKDFNRALASRRKFLS